MLEPRTPVRNSAPRSSTPRSSSSWPAFDRRSSLSVRTTGACCIPGSRPTVIIATFIRQFSALLTCHEDSPPHQLTSETEHVVFNLSKRSIELLSEQGRDVPENSLPVQLVPDGLPGLVQRVQRVVRIADARDERDDDDFAFNLARDHGFRRRADNAQV